MAADKGCTPAQLALAWVFAQGTDVVPIPGTRSRERLDENAESLQIGLSSGELAHIEEIFPADEVAGTRYPEAMMSFLNG
jgi:aryl-alcohol dehydrogenase-like predicted oxidoreductase